MIRGTRSVGPLLTLSLALVLGACTAAQADSPTAVVHDAFELIDAGDLEGLVELTCEAERDTVRTQFDFSDIAGMLPGNVDLEPLFEALVLETSDLEVSQVEVGDDAATVHLGGSIGFSFEAEQLREVLRAAVEAQGIEIDDAQLTMMIAALSASSQELPVDQDIELVREEGSWRICSRLTLFS